ncbi:MAG: ABC transporter ATP-binding protein [Cytophagales bacterium]|nr:MAG: ABC transporter ATP-binding protein [Cytophagales bacterium]
MLSIFNFEKRYPSGFEVKIDSLQLGQGIHLVLGGNGSGKSTLLKALAGIHPAKGNVLLDGTSLAKQPTEYRRKIGFAEAEPHFPQFLSLTDLTAFVAKAKSAPTSEIEDLTSRFGTDHFSSYPIGGYSSGMLKKTALILAFLGHPRLIILDEPFTTIDAETQYQLIQLIQKRASEGTSFLITSHQQNPLSQVNIQSILRMDAGKIKPHG